MNGSDSVDWNMTSTNSSKVNEAHLPILMVISGFVITSNLLVLTVLFCKSQIRKNHRLEFILWLCLTDIVVGIGGYLFVFNYVIKDLFTNVYYCILMYHFNIAAIGQSLALAFLICIDRYLAIAATSWYQRFNKKYRYIVIFVTCFLIHGFIGTMGAMFMRVDSITCCSIDSFPNRKIFMIAINFLFLPLLIVIPCLYIYSMIIFTKLKKRTHSNRDAVLSVANSDPSSQSRFANVFKRNANRQNYEKRVIVTTGLIVVTLLLLSGPFIIIILFLEGNDIIAVSRSTRMFITMLTYCNSAVNPILYIWRIRKVRQVLTKCFCPCKFARTLHIETINMDAFRE